jgi:hypothetical protein
MKVSDLFSLLFLLFEINLKNIDSPGDRSWTEELAGSMELK